MPEVTINMTKKPRKSTKRKTSLASIKQGLDKARKDPFSKEYKFVEKREPKVDVLDKVKPYNFSAVEKRVLDLSDAVEQSLSRITKEVDTVTGTVKDETILNSNRYIQLASENANLKNTIENLEAELDNNRIFQVTSGVAILVALVLAVIGIIN